VRYRSGKGVYVIKSAFVRWLATGSYVGYSPIAPGTCGTVVGLVLFFPLALLPLPLYAALCIGLTASGIWAAGETERLLGRKDASPIVIDEITGILLTYFAVPVRFFPLLAGFVVFRLADIFKPLPQLERLPGGWGVMLDDLFAALLAQGCVRLLLLFM
jgi:phosphatidylglycerophosphatase A